MGFVIVVFSDHTHYLFLQVCKIALQMYMQSKKEGKDQESIQSSTTHDSGNHTGKRQKHKKTSLTREPRGQPFPNSEHKAARNRQASFTKTNSKHK